MSPSRVRVSVPASSANLGPGFDCLGLALELRNEIELEPAPEGWSVECEGLGAGELPRDETNLIVRSARALLDSGRHPVTGLRVRARSRIPLAAGLGSSAATAVGALAAANRLAGAGLDDAALLRHAQRIEGHADNAAAALMGGLVLVAPDGEEALARRVPVAPLRVAVVTPSFGLTTAEMRAGLPQRVALADAVFNLGRALLVVEALREGDYELLGRALSDRLHEPHRGVRIPGYAAVRAAAREAGAAAVALSGAGPSLIAFAGSGHEAIGAAMVAAWQGARVAAVARVLEVSQRGVELE